MLTRDQQVSRRVGRMEALVTDIGQLPEGYQPTELETIRAQELQAALSVVLGRPEPNTQTENLEEVKVVGQEVAPQSRDKGKSTKK